MAANRGDADSPGTGDRQDVDSSAITAAVELVDHYRATRARPLARVNANLRYYVQKVGADPEVTQRLKRFTTIVNKLQRHANIALSAMRERVEQPPEGFMEELAERYAATRRYFPEGEGHNGSP